MALYRRYRPQKFQDVIGQDQVTKPLMAALRGERTAHAYLFSGPRGCGKTTSARILARCLNCAQGPTDTPCGECDSCRELGTSGSGSLDVIEMDAASHGGVDDARDLVERAAFAPVRDRYKIFIVDEAHMVTNQGFNALLKLVEEPPDYIKFIFATTEPEKVIPTIRSRTHHYPFRLVPPELLEELMSGLCAEEGVEIGAGVLPLVVRAGAGSVRDSLSVLDQLIGGSDDSSVSYEAAIGLLGYTDSALLDDAVDAIAAQDGKTLFDVVDRIVQSGHAPRRFVEDLLQRLRDLIILSLAGDSAVDALSSVPADQLERMQKQAAHLGAARASRSADLTNEALSSMVGATSPRLQLELLCARLLLPSAGEQSSAAASASAAVPSAPASKPAPPSAQTISKLREQFGNPSPKPEPGAPARPAEPEAKAAPADFVPADNLPTFPSPADMAAEKENKGSTSDSADTENVQPDVPKPAPPKSSDTLTIRRRWPEVLEAIKVMPGGKSTAPLLAQCAQVGSYDDGVLTLQFTNEGMARNLTEERSALIASALYDVLGIKATVSSQTGNADIPKVEAGSAGSPSLPNSDAVPVDVPGVDGDEAPKDDEVHNGKQSSYEHEQHMSTVPTPPPMLEAEEWHAPSVPEYLSQKNEGKSASDTPSKEVSAITQQIRERYGQGEPEPEPAPAPDTPELLVSEDEAPEMFISPDDPTIDQSTVLGLNVVLETFSGTLLASDEAEQGGE